MIGVEIRFRCGVVELRGVKKKLLAVLVFGKAVTI
jgi:hypothetical protein